MLWAEGTLYESTGLYGGSTLRQVDLESGEILALRPLPDHLFGEGLTLFGDRLIQLTWQANVGLVYDKDSLELLDEFYYPGEGWGLTYDGQHLILSDGSATLRRLDPETYQPVGQVEVRDGYGPVSRLNELEYVRGEIYANVWQSDRIARIDPQTGRVTGWIWVELDGLFTPEEHSQPIEVLNGIAYDAQGERLFVTGKLWPRLFEVELPSSLP